MVRGAGRKTQKRGAFGTAHKLPSGRYRAMYYGPTGAATPRRRHSPPRRTPAAWLALRQADIIRKAWMPPEADEAPQPKLTFSGLRRHLD